MATGKKHTAKSRGKRAPSLTSRHWGTRLLLPRLRVLLALAVVVLLGLGMRTVWRRVAPAIIYQPQYLLAAERITMSPQPEWIAADVRGEVVRNSGLDGRLSTLDGTFMDVLQDAFLLHPWVESVRSIAKQYPGGAHVELTYRKPVAVIEMSGAQGVQLIPIDRRAVHLPESDVPENFKRFLPRIQNVATRPPVGQRWDDLRVQGAAEIALRLGEQWETLSLVDILPSSRPEIMDEHRYFVYDLMTRGGTRVVWGAAPTTAPPGEDSFNAKLQRLQACIAKVGPLTTVRSPAVVDVRNQLTVTPRTVKKKLEPRTVNQESSPAEETPLVK